MDRKKLLNNIYVYGIPLLIIWILGMLMIQKSPSIKIVGDEFGYWSAGAWMSGYDWSDVASYNNYYGYGYGVFLMFILKLPVSQVVKYQLSIVLNVAFLSAIYLLIFTLIKKIADDLNIVSRVLLALTITLYPGIFFYSQFTLPEVIINLIYWVMTFLAYSILQKYTFQKIIVFSLLLVYSMTIHLRLVGIVFVGCLFLIYVIGKNKKYKEYIYVAAVLVIGIFLVMFIKQYYQSTYLTNNNSSILAHNDFGGQLEKIKELFSFSGVGKLLLCLMGKVYYGFSSSYLLLFLAVIIVFKCMYQAVKENKINNQVIMLTYLFLNCLAMMCVASIFMLDYSERFDLLIYGRYFEFTICPLMLIALIYIIQEKIEFKLCAFIVLAYIALTVLIDHVIPHEAPKSHIYFTCISIADSLYNGTLVSLSMKVIIVFSVIVLVIKKNKKIAPVFCLLGILVNWVFISYYAYENRVLSWAEEDSAKEQELANYICEIGAENYLYYYVSEDYLKIDFLQFLLGDTTIKCIYSADDIDNLPENEYLLTTYFTKLSLEDELEEYVRIAASNKVILWQHK